MASIVDRAPSLDALRAHRLQLIAANQWHAAGRAVPRELVDEQRDAAMRALAAPLLLKRARESFDGPLLVIKGPEVAAAYPRPADRPFRDLDILAQDADGAQAALLSAGFVLDSDPEWWEGSHQLAPLALPGLELGVEVHRVAKVPPWGPFPTAAELLSDARPSATGIDGLLAPAPAKHAVLLAAHAWTHRSFGRLGDLIDIAVMLAPDDRPEAARFAARWGLGRLWRRTVSISDALFHGAPRPLALRFWCRYLEESRDLSVIEHNVLRVAGPLAGAPARRLPRALQHAARVAFVPWTGETWADKFARVGRSLIHPLAEKSDHDRGVGNNPWQR